MTSEDERTLWVGNLDEKVTEELLYELFLQTGPIEKLILPTEGEKVDKKHSGHAYVLFKHADSVQYASQVVDGTTLFNHSLSLKARGLPQQYKKPSHHSSNSYGPRDSRDGRGGSRFDRDRYDNSSLRGGFQRSSTWHGNNNSSYTPRSRGGGGYRGRSGGYGGYQSNNSYNNSSSSSYSSSTEDKRQRLLQQQNITLEAHRQIQQQWSGNNYSNSSTSGDQGYNNYYYQQQSGYYKQ